jgi:hypothetical protein
MRSNRFVAFAALALAVLAWLPAVPSPARGAEGEAAPGGITVPEGYRDWVAVAPSQRDDKDELRVILGNPAAVAAYRKGTLPFPDGAILAKLAWKRVRSAEFDNTWVPGAPQRVEFMVKDSTRFAASGGWGFARFVNGKAADEKTHQSCFPCHKANVKGNDFVFTRYAP